MANRENKCVVCGSAKDYARFFIIPSLYRTHLPDGLKSHRSHDIVLMCFGCHDLASRRQNKLKTELAIKHDAPLTEFMPNKMKNVHIQSLNRAATTIMKNGSKMPAEKVKNLQDNLIRTLSDNRDLFSDTVPEAIMADVISGSFT